jgi:hypothetical protein
MTIEKIGDTPLIERDQLELSSGAPMREMSDAAEITPNYLRTVASLC